MKPISHLLLAIPAIVLCSSAAFAADRSMDDSSPQARGAKDSEWNVRVEVLMVALPQDKALALLPDLRDPARIESAVAQIFAAIDRKEATLMGYPIVQTKDDERGVAETIIEKR